MTDDSRFGRRDLLRGLGAGATATLAGCDALRPAGVGGTGDENTRIFFRFFRGPDVPTMVKLNPFAPVLRWGMEFTYEPFAHFDHVAGEFLPALAEDWSFRDDSLRVVLREDAGWSNGDPVTTADVDVWLTLASATNRPIAGHVADWTLVDDRTVDLSLSAPDRNERLLAQWILQQRVTAYRGLWAEDAATLRDASEGSDAYDSTVESVVKRSLSADDVVGNGPFPVTEVTNGQTVILSRNDHHHFAADCDVPEVRHYQSPESGQAPSGVGALEDGSIDFYGDLGVRSRVQQRLGDDAVHAVRQPLGGTVLYFNHDREPWGDTAVRRAVGYVASAEQVHANKPLTSLPAPGVARGMANLRLADRWVEDTAGFANFESTARHVRARRLFREAGFELNADDEWVDGAGDPVQVALRTPRTAQPSMDPTTTVEQQLARFGLSVEVSAVKFDQWGDEVWRPGDFDLVVGPDMGGTPPVWHPWHYFGGQFASDRVRTGTGMPESVDVPATVGDPDSATESVPVADLAASLADRVPEDRGRETVRRLAWAVNQTVPCRYLVTRVDHRWFSEKGWQVPAVPNERFPPSRLVVLSPERLLARGVVTPK